MGVLLQLFKQIHTYISGRRDSVEAKRAKDDKIEAPFLDEISGLAILKLLDKSNQSILMLKVKFMWNTAMLDITNISSETPILSPKEVIGILD